jgi:hypothetical protein
VNFGGCGPAMMVPSGRLICPDNRFLDIGPQSRVGDQLRGLRPTCGHVGFSLRDRRPVLQLPAPGGSVAPQFP